MIALPTQKISILEHAFLRTQISPHFIFNTLNNIYTLAIQKHDNTAPMVAKLSTLMRYVLYEGNMVHIGKHDLPISKGQREAFLEMVQRKGIR